MRPPQLAARAVIACRDSLAHLGSLRGCVPALDPWPRRSNRRGFLFQGGHRMIDPFTVVAMALGFAMVASLMLATIKQ